ncbi:MAG: Prolipoprotein diacylglyceryl transferase [Anaerolineales bacterium]|nr:Prolipoprotein diacylglyceryl transferase [Anaerolineales bacterium]
MQLQCAGNVFNFLQFDGLHFCLFDGESVLHFYGLIIMLGAVAGTWLAGRQAQHRGQDPAVAWDLLIYLLVSGVIGARLWHIFTPPPSSVEQGITTAYYLTHPFDAVAIWNGGLGIPGAVMAGALVLWWYTRKHNLSFLEWADIAVPSLALGQALGRWGNFFNQELYGAPTNLPWRVFIDPAHRVSGFESYEYFHPLFLYESFWNLGNMFLLLWLGRRFPDRLKPGDLLFVYLIVYPVGRFLLDFLRLDASLVGGVNANQTFMAFVAVASALTLFLRRYAPARTSAAG